MFLFNHLFIKFISFIVFFFSLTIGIYLTFFIQSVVRKEERAIFENGLNFSELSALVLYQDFLTASSRGFPRFEDIAQERLKKNADITRAMLIATNGKIIFDSNDFSSEVISGRTGGSVDRFITDQEIIRLLPGNTVAQRTIYEGNERFTEFIVPIIEVGGGHLFSMRYLLSYRSLEEHKLEIYQNSLFTLLPLFFITVGGGIVLAISIVRPIQRISKATEKIQQGDFMVQIPVRSKDEIGKLTAAFNQMVTTIASSQNKLKEYSQTLEQQVQQRTKELQSKVVEFERMNKLMTGRKLKMTELKRENEPLRQKIGAKNNNTV